MILQNYIIIDGDKGKSLIANKNFKKDEIVIREDNYWFGTGDETSDYAIQVGDDLFLDTVHPKDPDFVNHSCNPNMIYDTKSFMFITIKDIQKGDELTIDYEQYEDDLVKDGLDFICKCNEINCRGRIIGKMRKHQTTVDSIGRTTE